MSDVKRWTIPELGTKAVFVAASDYDAIAAENAKMAEALIEAHELLLRSNAAMCQWFSNEFDSGASFSQLTSDIPHYFESRTVQPSGERT